MSYNTLTKASLDPALTNRVIAAVQKEARANPEFGDTDYGQLVQKNSAEGVQLVWPVCIDTEAAYESAVAAENPNPGGDESVITDAAIGAAVQAHWPADEATP
jgi:hypothetical protein